MTHPYADSVGFKKACEIVKKYNISFGNYEGINSYISDNNFSCTFPENRPNLFLHKARIIADFLFPRKSKKDDSGKYNINIGGVIFGLLFPEKSTKDAIKKYGIDIAIAQCTCFDNLFVANSLYKLTGELVIPHRNIN